MQCVNSTHNFLSIVYVGILLERKRKKPKISMSIVTGTHIRHRSILFKQIVRGLRRWSRIKRGFWHRLQFIWSSIMNSRRIFAGHENIHKHTHTLKRWRTDDYNRKHGKTLFFFMFLFQVAFVCHSLICVSMAFCCDHKRISNGHTKSKINSPILKWAENRIHADKANQHYYGPNDYLHECKASS